MKPPQRKRHVGPSEVSLFNWAIAGLPELALFQSDQQRDAAVAQVIRGVGWLRRKEWWLAVLVLVGGWGIIRLARIGLSQFIPGAQWSGDWLLLIANLFLYSLIMRWFYRGAAQRELRKQLLNQGVPVCVQCGYDLRGQPAAAPYCSECGRAIDNRVPGMIQFGGQSTPRIPPRSNSDAHPTRQGLKWNLVRMAIVAALVVAPFLIHRANPGLSSTVFGGAIRILALFCFVIGVVLFLAGITGMLLNPFGQWPRNCAGIGVILGLACASAIAAL